MIYLDNAATTKPNEEAFARAQRETQEIFFNPSAKYSGGFSAQSLLKKARQGLCSLVADGENFSLIFTSGGTEADNQAVFGAARRGNAVTTAGEHAAVFRSFNELKNRGVEPRFAPLNRDGSVDSDALLSLVDEKTSLVSVVHVNNETGAVNDVAALAKAVKAKNPRTLFHSDGVQAFGKIPFRLPKEIDLYSVSAHKIGGLKGTGALIKRRSLVLPPLIFGGGQEEGLRSGTENVLGALTFFYAAGPVFSALSESATRVRECRELLYGRLKEDFLRISSPEGTPYILSVSLAGARGEVLERMLSDRGVIVGTGSACSSKDRFSRVIGACGYKEDVLDGVLRMSFSRETTKEETMRAAEEICRVAKEFRQKLA